MISGHCGSTHEPYVGFNKLKNTVNSKIFMRALFSQNFPYARSFAKIKPLQNGEITLSFTDEGKSFQSRKCLRHKYVGLLALFAKISEFTLTS